MWNQVLQKLTDRNDIENCSNSSPFFLSFLRNKRETSVVLPEVFVLLMEYFEEHVAEEDDNNGSNDDNTNENMEGDNNGNNDDNANENMEVENNGGIDTQNSDQIATKTCILKCREICKAWSNVIDGLYGNPNREHFMLTFEMNDFPLLKFTVDGVYSFHPEHPFRDFLQHFDSTHYNFEAKKPTRNPFLGKQVEFFQIRLRNQVQQADEDYIDEIINILKKYGTYVWYAMLDFEVEFGGNVCLFYMQLLEFLKMMPNLKVLRLHFNESWDNLNLANIPIGFVEMGALLLRNSERDALRRTVSQCPSPLFKSIQFIDTENVPTTVFNELITKCNNLTQLQVERKDFHLDYGIFTMTFPNLTALNIKFCTIADFEKLENCNMSMKLKRFYFWYEESSQFFPWSRLFRALENQLGANCEELVLQLPMPKSNEEINQVLVDSRSCRLNLPNLQRITIFDDMAYCLDFLLPCKVSLEQIVLRYSNDEDDDAIAQHIRNTERRFPEFEKGQSIGFLGFREKLEESNIWGEFSKLRRITVHRNRKMGGCIDYFGNRKGSGVVHKNVWHRD